MSSEDERDVASNAKAPATGSVTLTAQQMQDIIQGAVAGAVASALAAHSGGNAAQAVPHHESVKRPDRPSIDLECGESRWSFFVNEWQLYKRRANITTSGAEELRACCSEDLRMELFDFVGPAVIDSLNEEQLFAKVKGLAVKGKNMAVHRQEFYAMQQAPSQPIQQFVAKLRAKAEHCSFQLKCSSPNCNNTTNSYMASMVADQMTVGCYDKDIQGEVLAKHSQITTFDEKFDLIQALEDGKRAKQQLGSESSLAAQRSTYQRGRNRPKTPTPIGGKNAHKYSCSGCGSTDHGSGTDKSRKHHCPAWREQCSNCLTKGHLATVRQPHHQTCPSHGSSHRLRMKRKRGHSYQACEETTGRLGVPPTARHCYAPEYLTGSYYPTSSGFQMRDDLNHEGPVPYQNYACKWI